MSFWTFIFMFCGSYIPCWIGMKIFEFEEKDNADKKEGKTGCVAIFFACLFMFGGLSMIGYSIYKYFIYDYTEAIEEAIVEHDFEEAHELLFEMSQLSSETKEEDFLSGEKYKSKYTIASEKVLKAEVTFLMNSRDKESSDRLISIIGNLPIEASPTVGITHDSQTQKNNEAYSIYVGKFNAQCDDILNSAISTGNRYLAERILTMYKPTLNRELEESNFFSTDAYKYSYSNEMQIAARKRFEEAVKAGVFNNYKSDGTSSQSSNVDLSINNIESGDLFGTLDSSIYGQNLNSIIRELSSKYGNEVSIENNYSESSKYCSFWLKDESGSNRYLLIYNLENGNHKKFDTQNINTINGGEIYMTNCGTSITPNNRILIEGDNGASSIDYTKYIIEINPSDWQAKEICSGAEIVKDTNGYLVKKIIMSKWNTCNADSEYISIEIMYDLNGNITLPSSYEQAYKLHGLIDDKYPITMNLAMSDTQLYGKYYYDKNGDNNNFLYLFGGVSKSGDIIILEYNKQGDQTSKFKGRIINNSFSGIFTNYKKIDMPFKLIFSSNNINSKVRKFICNGDMAGFPIEMDIIVNEDNTINGEYRNVKYKVNYDLTGWYNNGHFSIKGHHGKALVEFNLSIDNNTIIGHGSDGKNTLNVKMNYTINNENEYSTDVNINTRSYKKYYNSRFNFTVKYPSFLGNITNSENGDGCMFSKDSNTYLKVYGMHNVLNSTIEKEFNKYKSQSPIYSLQKNNWFVISDYTEDGHIYYLKTVLRNDVFITGYIQYPSDQKDLYSKIITEIFKNFPN